MACGYGSQCISIISTDLALLELSDKIAESIDAKKYTIGIFVDLSKAFDTLNHGILLQKLFRYGIRGIANNWFQNYLGKTAVCNV